jgi:hypothetical protein
MSITAHADACFIERATPWIWPRPLDTVPLNGHVTLWLENGWATRKVCSGGGCAEGSFRIVVRTAATPSSPSHEVDFDVVRSLPTLEIAPKGLQPNTRYEVLLVEKLGRAAPELLSTFRVGTVKDTTPPAWTGAVLSSVELTKRGLLCDYPVTVVLTYAPIVDASPLLFDVWVSAPGGTNDTTKPPTTIETAQIDRVVVAGYYPREKDVRFTVRPRDAAGNVGTISELVVDTR